MYITDDTDLEAALSRKPVAAPMPAKIYEGVADHETTFELINRYSRGNRFAGLGFKAGQWFETTEDIYWHFLESLPPLHQTGAGFVVGECTTGDLYQSFMEIDGRFFCAVVAWDGRRSFSALWTALVAEVQS